MTTQQPEGSAPATVAVVGATGTQGGAVVRALLERGHRVRALTRDTTSDAAAALADLGADPVEADPADPGSLDAAFAGVDAVSAMTPHPRDVGGPDAEVAQGVALADAADRAGVRHLVYSSVGGAERGTGIPHFDSKHRVEQHLGGLGVPWTVVRPVFFMENLLGTEPRDGRVTVQLPLPDGRPLQLVAAADIGRVVAAVVLDDAWFGRAVEIAGDERTGSQLAAAFAAVTGLPASYEALPLDVLDDEDSRLMFAWFDQPHAYAADVAATRELDPRVQDLEAFLRAHGRGA